MDPLFPHPTATMAALALLLVSGGFVIGGVATDNMPLALGGLAALCPSGAALGATLWRGS